MLGNNNISVTLVKNTLGENTNSVGGLCTSNKINMLSKHKPVRLATDNTDSNPNWWKTSNNMCGINIPVLASIRDVTTANWTYEKPRGGSAEPYRLGDFRGYEHLAIPDVCSGKKADMVVDIFNDKQFTIGQETPLNSGSLQASDFSGSSIGSYYFTAYITTEDGQYNVVQSAPVNVANGGKTVTFPTSLFQSGVWQKSPCKCSVALSYVKQDASTGLQSTTWMSVYRDSLWKNPFYITFRSDMPLDFYLRAVGRNPQEFHSMEESVVTSGFEVNQNLSMKVLIQNTSNNVYYLSGNAVTLGYRNFKNERVERIPAPLYTQDSSGNIKPVSGNLTIPANGSVEVVLNDNFLFKDTNGVTQSPNVSNGTIVTTGFDFYVQHNGMKVLASSTPAYKFKYNNLV